MNKFLSFVNWAFFVVIFLAIIGVVLNFFMGAGELGVVENYTQECIDINEVASFDYGACYDTYSGIIFLKAGRPGDDYSINSLDVSFVDLSTKSYELEDVPSVGGEESYMIPADKNPQTINIDLNILKNFKQPICDDVVNVYVEYCPVGTSGQGVDVLVNPIGDANIKDFIIVEDVIGAADSDIFTLDLVGDEVGVWDIQCDSNWDCSEWGPCEDGRQYRDCADVAACPISKDSPDTVRGCDGQCVEDWQCIWGPCSGGLTIPDCRDLNSCGTRYDIPSALNCDGVEGCISDIKCEEWSECNVDYNFFNLIGGKIAELDGVRTRLCVDKSDCILPQKEVQDCSVGIDVYTDKFERCGREYIGVYNKLDGKLLAILEEGYKNNPYFNIYFDDEISIQCDYCFDGIMNGDEENVDCGGSCKECVDEGFYEEGFFDRLIDRIF